MDFEALEEQLAIEEARIAELQAALSGTVEGTDTFNGQCLTAVSSERDRAEFTVAGLRARLDPSSYAGHADVTGCGGQQRCADERRTPERFVR
jgi:hypothetical protein